MDSKKVKLKNARKKKIKPVGNCEHCGKKDGVYTINPYDEDVKGIETMQYICNDCDTELRADI